MQITFVTPWYNNFAGGAEVAVRTLAENLSRRGFDVQVLTTCCCSPFDNWWQNKLPSGVEKINGVTVRRFPVKRHGEQNYHEINHRIIQRQKIEEKYQRQFVENSINSEELIHYAKNNTQGHLVIGIPYTQGLIYSLIKSLEGRASIMPCFHDEPQFRWITTVEMLELSRHIFFLTEEEKSLAIKYYGNSFGRKIIEATVIGVGVELPIDIDSLILNSSLVTRITSHYNLPRKFFIYVGRKDIGKNILTLIQFFKNYRANGGEANLVFLGGGDTNLVPLEEGFLDLGFVPETDKYIIISQALGLINLSQNESFSLVIMEAWLCEIPVIVHEECKVTTAHCRNTGGGISILCSEEFETALKILSIQDKGKIIGRYGKRYVKRNYSWDCVIESFLRGAYQR
ncbi:MAG: glycosyltransferase family 4 protein [Nostoc sp.]|uniref:glycosyltransferase family 4 protein n=1 Tax=Nostoc sp. TaxID=1180 RepID=UPI002FF829F3